MAVIKLGKKGALAVKDGEVFYAPTYKVNVMDTTGAGDSFNAGFVYGFVCDMSVQECLKRGNGCGSLSASMLGGNTGFPFRDQLESWIQSAQPEIESV
jgi:sugar/nucleoside kinase (ribokinase family)